MTLESPVKLHNLPEEVVLAFGFLLFADEQENCGAEGEDAHQPRHGGSSRDEGCQAGKQKVNDHEPGGKGLGHIHFSLLLGRMEVAQLPSLGT